MTRASEAAPAEIDAPTWAGLIEGNRLHSLPYVPALDGLRGIAIISVVLGHLGILTSGQFGVDVFFVLSGFLITQIIMNSYSSRNFFPIFYYRRFVRLYPALLVVCAVFCVFIGIILRDQSIYVDAIASLWYVQSIVSAASDGVSLFLQYTWSLSVEEQFYILWPFAIVLAARANETRGPLILALTLLVAILAWKYVLLGERASVSRMYFPLDTRGDALIIGAIGAIVRPAIFVHTRRIYIDIFSLLSVIVLADLILGIRGGHFGIRDPIFTMFVFDVASLGVVLGCIGPVRNPTSIALSASPLVWFGKISYSLYLWHSPLLLVLRYKLQWSDIAIKLIGLPLALALSCLSYYGLERTLALRRGELSLRLQRKIGQSVFVFSCIAIVLGTLFFQWSDIRELFDATPLTSLESWPHVHQLGQTNDLQPDGNLVFGFVPSRRVDLGAYAVVDGVRVVTAVSRNSVSFTVPKTVLSVPGRKRIQLFDSRDKLILDKLTLDVVGSG